MRSVSILFASLLLLPALAQAASMVQVVGLFPGAAVVNVDGQRLVRVGQTALAASGGERRCQRCGAARRWKVERHYNLSSTTAGLRKRQDPAERLGIMAITGSSAINGQSIQFLVDTGATWWRSTNTPVAWADFPYQVGPWWQHRQRYARPAHLNSVRRQRPRCSRRGGRRGRFAHERCSA